VSTDLKQLRTYQLQECLGGSNIAEVWKAFDLQSQGYVALKIFHSELQNDSFFMTRFWNLPLSQEAQQLLSLHHPNIVQIHSFQISHPSEADHPLAYIVMDYVEGSNLADYIRDTSYKRVFPSATDIVHLFASIGASIDYAHREGVIHGEIKPTNILLDKRNTTRNPMGEPVLADTGITKLLGISTGTFNHPEKDTTFYMSPEQILGHPASERSDLYALGVILYELCTGELPFHGENEQDIMMQHLNSTPSSPALINPAISPALSAVIERSIEKDPEKRFSSATAMVTSLAEALQVPLPENTSPPEKPANTLNGQTDPGPTLFTPSTEVASLPSSPTDVTGVSSSESSIAENSREAEPTSPAPTTLEEPSIAYSSLNSSSAHPRELRDRPATVSPLPDPSTPTSRQEPLSKKRSGGSFMSKFRNVFLVILILLLILSTLGALFVLQKRQTNTASSSSTTTPIVGHVYFLSSGQLYVHNNQGINDQVLIDLHHLAPPAPGKSYYAWLLGDKGQAEVPWVALGALSVTQGNVHFLFPGDQAHSNLLNDMSRFVITEGNANTAPDNPLLDQSAWRYYGEIYQSPSAKDVNHFSLLDHLRHLLVQAPELASLSLAGGLSIWLLRNVEEISYWALAAKDRSESKQFAFIRQQLVNILYYLDGECTQADFQGLPSGTPTQPGNATIGHIAHFAILNQCVLEEQEQANTLKHVFAHTPHNYVDHLLFHMAGVIVSPGATPFQHTLALQINTAINNVRGSLSRVHQDAVQLLHMTDQQLTGIPALESLGDLEAHARYAYSGQTDPTSGVVQQGTEWIYDNVERLATFDVTPYSSH
jgi:eukaryotic-like serine/threonine-protein kinase